MPKNKRVAFLVYVDLDSVPGTMHTEDSAQAVVQDILGERLEAYNPTVYIADEKAQIK